MGKLKYLANNLALFSVSNFVSKILVFLLVPLYTNVLTTREYGIADIFQVTLLLLVPALTVNMGEGALRFGIDKGEKRPLILRIGLKYTLLASAAVALLCIAATFFLSGEIRRFPLFFAVLFLTNALYEFLILYFQGCEQVKIVVVGSILCTLMTILCNLYFLLVLRIGLNGYLFSQMIAFGTAGVTMFVLGRAMQGKECRESGSDLEKREMEKELLSYGKPLILYSTGSWINNAADRYLVLYLCSAAVNGLYGVAYKIPAILMVFQRIFAQAWQMSATKSYRDKESEAFFSTMYASYHTFMVLACSLLILFLKVIAAFLFRKDFYSAWTFVPPLLISVIFGALTGFLGSICLAHKDSRSMGIATGIGAALNIGLNLLLIPRTGAMGAAIATAASYFTMYFMALMFTRKYVKIRAHFFRDYCAYALLVVEAVAMICLENEKTAYILSAAIVLLLILMHLRETKKIVHVALNALKGVKDKHDDTTDGETDDLFEA